MNDNDWSADGSEGMRERGDKIDMDRLQEEDYEEYLEEVRKQEKWRKLKVKVAMIGLALLSIEVVIKMICGYIEFING